MGGDEVIVAGIGCRRGCPADDIVALVHRAGALAGCRPALLAAPDFKAGEAGLHAAAAWLGLQLHLVEAPALAAAQAACVTRSTAAMQAVGVASVAEGSALAAAGAGARLRLARISGPRASCALAETGPRETGPRDVP